MIVDNFEYLSKLFDELIDKDDFYFVQIIQRKKDGIELPSYTSGARKSLNETFRNLTLVELISEE